jgi:hypothetical protein
MEREGYNNARLREVKQIVVHVYSLPMLIARNKLDPPTLAPKMFSNRSRMVSRLVVVDGRAGGTGQMEYGIVD